MSNLTGTGHRPAVRLLCDEMLAGLARWLRAAGYDAIVAETGADDRWLLETAIAQNRILLTRDRAMTQQAAAAGRVEVLETEGIGNQARELRDRLAIDWLLAPFSRCLIDNVPVRPCDDSEEALMPSDARLRGSACTVCPVCARIYWLGGHHRRMMARLARWAGRERGPEATEVD